MMNLQRREEIRVMMNRLESTEWVEAGEYKEAMSELLAHIDTLEQTAAERVIADGSRGPTPDYTGEGSAWVPPVEVRAAVGPELTLHDVIDIVGCDDSKPWEIITSELNKKLHSRSRAIPAGRVPGEGMAAVKWISVNDALPENGQTVGFVTECANDKWYHGRVLGGRYMAGEFGGFSVPGLMVQASHWFAFPPLPDALRANQGGADARKAN